MNLLLHGKQLSILANDKIWASKQKIRILANFYFPLCSTCSQYSKDFPDGLLIQADDDSEHGAIVRAMDSARNVGITSISLARN